MSVYARRCITHMFCASSFIGHWHLMHERVRTILRAAGRDSGLMNVTTQLRASAGTCREMPARWLGSGNAGSCSPDRAPHMKTLPAKTLRVKRWAQGMLAAAPPTEPPT